jgi:hypothetical protein
VPGSLTKQCSRCKRIKKLSQFAINKSLEKQRDAWCNKCRKEYVKDLNTLKEYLQENNRGFSEELWKLASEIAEESVNKLEFTDIKEKEKVFERKRINLYFSKMNLGQYKNFIDEDADSENIETEKPIVEQVEDKDEIPQEFIDKWGEGFASHEYRLFEKKYQQLRNSYQIKTAMHEEYLIVYCRARVKEELATAKGDVKEAKEWANMAKDAAVAGKLQPSQMSKADLQDGLDTFGQLTRMVEQEVDIIPILPQFKKRPKDDADFTIWCYINYVRDLKGLPLCTYDEIYRFYEQRKKEYEEAIKKDVENDAVI